MRNRILVLTLLGGLCLFARQSSHEAAGSQQTASQQMAAEDEEASLRKWKLINSGIFLLLLGFVVIKYSPRFFQARSLDIQKAIKDATGLKIEADFRYSEIDKKMAHLADAVERMKAEAAEEMKREQARLNRETAEEIEHLNRNTDYEIESLRAEGAQQVKRHTAQLALAMAERRLQAHYSQNDGQDGVREFLSLIGSGRNYGGKN